MSVDFYSCDCCGETFPDCGFYITCDCGKKWCSHLCAEDDGYDGEKDSCSFCRNEKFTDTQLLEYIMNVQHINRQVIIDSMKSGKIS